LVAFLPLGVLPTDFFASVLREPITGFGFPSCLERVERFASAFGRSELFFADLLAELRFVFVSKPSDLEGATKVDLG
jgi:hypothetical protein